MLVVLAFLAQAVLPPPGLHYFARTDYSGPGLVCGAAFSIHLEEGETAVRTKRIPIDDETEFHTRDGQFTVHETPYETEGGKLMRKVAEGDLRRKHEKSGYVWIYRGNAPGSTVVSGPAMDARKPSLALRRITFGGPRYGFVGSEKCLDGIGSEPRVSWSRNVRFPPIAATAKRAKLGA